MVFATHIISHCTYCIYLHVVCIIVACFIYSRTLAPVAIVICWLYPTQNRFYLILSYLIFKWTWLFIYSVYNIVILASHCYWKISSMSVESTMRIGPILIYRLTSIWISIIKIRRSHDRLIFIMRITIPEKTFLYRNRGQEPRVKHMFYALYALYPTNQLKSRGAEGWDVTRWFYDNHGLVSSQPWI